VVCLPGRTCGTQVAKRPLPPTGPARVCALLAGLGTIVSGCGTQTRPPLRLTDWLSYDAVRKAAAITVIPAYNRSYQGFNLNGYAKGEVDVIVPVGWTVTVRCLNTGLDGRHSCAIVRGPNATHPALAGAASPDPLHGLAHGQSASFSFFTKRARRLSDRLARSRAAAKRDVGRPGNHPQRAASGDLASPCPLTPTRDHTRANVALWRNSDTLPPGERCASPLATHASPTGTATESMLSIGSTFFHSCCGHRM
jgi:hypothetical protein